MASTGKLLLFILSGIFLAGFAMYMNMTEQDWTQLIPTVILSQIKQHTKLLDNYAQEEQPNSAALLYDLSVSGVDGEEISMKNYSGKVLLIVNTASYCGFTPQLGSLQRLYEKFQDRGFEVLAFPCNQFGAQEPGNNQQVCSFAAEKYNVTFKIFDKVKVNGRDASPLFKLLKSQSKGFLTSDVKWNFTKFLVDRSGKVVKRFSPITDPESIAPMIEKLF